MELLLPENTGRPRPISVRLLTHCVVFRPESKGKGDMATEENPAYGLTGHHRGLSEDKGDHEIPHYPHPPSGAPEEGVYEGVY